MQRTCKRVTFFTLACFTTKGILPNIKPIKAKEVGI